MTSFALRALALVGLLAASALSLPAAAPLGTNELSAHLAELKTRVPRDFNIVVQPPFVLIGDEWPATLQKRATNTVKWAVDLLRKDFFTREPSAPVDVWLFKNNESYRKNTWKVFNRTPSTPYGFTIPEKRTLVVNISTGTGTLVHELVHPLLRADFPGVPTWFNEGFASLYEQSSERDGHIRGEPNWRLPGLQRDWRAGKVPSFLELTRLKESEFYGRNEAQFYAQARFLFFYLQEQGLLVRFYREFVANAQADPTGYATLQRVLGEADMDAFQQKWGEFVLKLKFP